MTNTQRPVLSGPLHVVWHVLLVVFGWGLFGGFWWVVLQQGPHSLSNIVWLIGGALVALPVVTLYWVMHNRGIYARKGPRQQVRIVETGYLQDWAARRVHADFTLLQRAAWISIDSTADEKHFLMPSAGQKRLEAA